MGSSCRRGGILQGVSSTLNQAASLACPHHPCGPNHASLPVSHPLRDDSSPPSSKFPPSGTLGIGHALICMPHHQTGSPPVFHSKFQPFVSPHLYILAPPGRSAGFYALLSRGLLLAVSHSCWDKCHSSAHIFPPFKGMDATGHAPLPTKPHSQWGGLAGYLILPVLLPTGAMDALLVPLFYMFLPLQGNHDTDDAPLSAYPTP